MNDENLRLTGTANTPYTSKSTAGTTVSLVETAVQYGKNRGGIAVLRVAGTISGTSSAAMGITIQQATTSAAASTLWFDIAVFPQILVDTSGGTQTGADITGIQQGVDTSAFAVKPEIPGTMNGPAVAFITDMDYIRVKEVFTAGTSAVAFNFVNFSVEVMPTQDVVKRSGIA